VFRIKLVHQDATALRQCVDCPHSRQYKTSTCCVSCFSVEPSVLLSPLRLQSILYPRWVFIFMTVALALNGGDLLYPFEAITASEKEETHSYSQRHKERHKMLKSHYKKSPRHRSIEIRSKTTLITCATRSFTFSIKRRRNRESDICWKKKHTKKKKKTTEVFTSFDEILHHRDKEEARWLLKRSERRADKCFCVNQTIL
jgi:hypothetical protein